MKGEKFLEKGNKIENQRLFEAKTNKRRCELHGQMNEGKTNNEQTMNEQWTKEWRTMNEEKTNDERRNDEGKAKLSKRYDIRQALRKAV